MKTVWLWMAAAVAGGLLGIASVEAQPSRAVTALLQERAVRAALEAARAAEPATIEEQVRFCEVPAPPFAETARGDLLRRAFADAGLRDVRIDRAGNVLGDLPGVSERPRLVVAAHLDTVFSHDVDVKVKREGSTLFGPGIGDNCRGLAVLVAVARAMRQTNVRTPGSITFVANVGEEGLGDLRGVKALFNETLKGQIDRFVSIDGTGLHVTHVAVGSRRYRVTFKGPGGHSYAAFGLANPVGALGRAVAKLSDLQPPSQPKTTFTVGRIGGGTSVNAIPSEAWMEVDMRSPDPAALAAFDAMFRRAVDAAVTEENQRWGRPRVITVVKELVGDRPAGATPANSPIVETARAVAAALGLVVALGEGSTDANIPIALKIPAITIGGGGRGWNGHALTEAFETADSWQGTQNAVLLTIALAQ